MSTHTATIRWKNTGPDFSKRLYSRGHTIHFDGGARVHGSASPHIVPAPWSNEAAVDPEEAFIASVAGCHMLWFLHVAVDQGFAAEGVMTRNGQGRLWVSRITLKPKVEWSGVMVPTANEELHMHHLAHEQCFIANSITTEVCFAL